MSKPDIVLISPGGRELIYQSLGSELTAIEPPLWCRLIAGYLIDRNITVEIIDSEALNWGPDRVAIETEAMDPSLVVMVVFGHQPSASTQMMAPAHSICASLKQHNPTKKILIVGGHVSALPEKTLSDEPVDYACVGEGPITIEGLLSFIKGFSSNIEDIPGLVWRENNKIKINKSAPLITDLDRDLHGNVWNMLPMEKYRAHNWQCFGDLGKRQPYASIYTSLGCPYQCVFCCINAPFESHKYRCRSPEKVVAEIDLLYTRYAVKTFKIIDEMFVLKKTHFLKICELLADKPYAAELNIWAYARIDTVQNDHLSILRKAGIRWLALGIESADESVRDQANKKLDQDAIIEVVRRIQAADINVMGNFIYGLPSDTMETMEETLDLSKKLRCEFVNFYSAMAYPGSRLYVQAIENGLPLPESWTGYSQHSKDCLPLPTQSLTSAEVLAFRDNAFHRYFEDPGYLKFIDEKFGSKTRQHIENMSKSRLERAIVNTTLK